MDASQEPILQTSQPAEARSTPPVDQPPAGYDSGEMSPEQKRTMIGIGVGILVILILTGLSIYYLGFVANPSDVTRIRDIFLIFLALQSFLIGLALVILMVQVARLINLLQNEIKPILDSTNETVSTLRGTTAFLSNNLVEPVIKLNEYLAGFAHMLQVIGVTRKTGKKE